VKPSRRDAPRRVRCVVTACATLLVCFPVSAAPQQLCDPEPLGSTPRPLWAELAPPGGSGYPDYQTVTDNLPILNSLTLLASIATRATQALQPLGSAVEDAEATGRCVCCLSANCALPEIHLNTVRRDCTAAQCSALESPAYPIWLPTDLFKDISSRPPRRPTRRVVAAGGCDFDGQAALMSGILAGGHT